jgi:putative transposase
LWLVFTVEETLQINTKVSTGKSGGFDFGLKTFLVDDEGRGYTSPQFFKQGLRKTRKLSREHSRKTEGSNRRKRARRTLARHHAHMVNKRRDHHFKLAHQLCDEYDVLYFEDLNLTGMKKWWGRKVSDLAFGSFLEILEWVALKRGKTVIKIDRFERTTQKCSNCEREHALTLKDRTLRCVCGLVIDRDHNAALNVKAAGASAACGSDRKPKIRLRQRADRRSPRL